MIFVTIIHRIFEYFQRRRCHALENQSRSPGLRSPAPPIFRMRLKPRFQSPYMQYVSLALEFEFNLSFTSRIYGLKIEKIREVYMCADLVLIECARLRSASGYDYRKK